MIERCTATLRIRGLVTNTVEKTKLSPMEILVLQLHHGKDCLVDFKDFEQDKATPMTIEIEHLRRAYQPIQLKSGDLIHPVDHLWPGFKPNYPRKLEDVGVVPRRLVEEPAEFFVTEAPPEGVIEDDGYVGLEQEEAA